MNAPLYRDELRDWLHERRRKHHDRLRKVYVRMGHPAGRTSAHPTRPDEVTMDAASLVRDFALPTRPRRDSRRWSKDRQ